MLKILKAGFYTSIQDISRFGFREYGVPISGAMDSYSAKFANSLLGNDANCAVMEMTMIGPKLLFQEPTAIVLSGANISPKINNVEVEMDSVLSVKTGDILTFGRLQSGLRTYLAIKNGFQSEEVLKSKSMYKGITRDSNLKDHETIKFMPFSHKDSAKHASVKYDESMLFHNVLETFKGPEFDKLSPNLQESLLNSEFKVSIHDRMAYQLKSLGRNNLDQILTSPVLPGTVQLTPSGTLLVLMRDCQTTGGYPRVLQLTEKAINILSQKNTGAQLRFRLKV
ncbi:biotin-dependent carboxyltransferase family protein [Winogradskyella sp. SYSU M77433]|uniref:5-oxoprolinase subunit C family protein n=1 Tax=Winogradskyella sp. SYSU M77433 TaxID=3042722 RepID=UPI0024804AF4|nr:biotin-dependent carboxyltransferase family protein [Winogradskyella sp. SYSU M77433]MDH7912432.1 biotin-dependent carboxyltransferase family protein [Winogradskyella sp. SYSU M77433]